jgi:serine/threonine protein kinase/Flp pilus assembly protein TadD
VSERTKKIEAIFHAASELSTPEERESYLNEACLGDEGLLKEVDALLKAALAGEGLFQGYEQSSRRSGNTAVETLAEQPGTVIGRYKLLEKIGEGGMGVVYMAEQEQPVRRKVALKIIKLGMDTRQVVARFEVERQALAIMDHPHIARVLDGGATETGRPYFVMELVQGVPITQFCEANRFSVEERLNLFIPVCEAIQSAHQKGIIHRDLKPSNVLVTTHNGAPHPMVIDFGVAKAIDQKLTEKTLFTNFATMIGTPAYMSPEQAEMSKLDVDTRADIYSLGVLLYELLTGTTPFPEERLRSVAYGEMQRIIAEEEPERPSTRLRKKATTGSAKPLVTTGHSSLATDLDWIVMKCLEKDRNRRYDTANGLAADLNRHLSNEPVMARPPSRFYEFQKTLRRHKVGFAATGAVILALAIGVGVSIWHAKKSALEAAKATAISDFLQEMLRSANPDAAKGTDYTVRQLLNEISAGLQDQLKNQPEVEASVRTTIGMAYYRLGDGAKAQQHLERALALRRGLYGEEHELVADTLAKYAWSLLEQHQPERTKKEARRALEIYAKNQAPPQQVIEALWVLQRAHITLSQDEEAARVTSQAVALAERNPNQPFPVIASMLHGLAESKVRQGEYKQAESLALRAVAVHRRFRGEGHVEVAWALLCLGRAQKGDNKLKEAESTLREALAIFRKCHSENHKSISHAINALKGVLQAKGDVAGSEAIAQEELPYLTKQIEENSRELDPWLRRAVVRASSKMWIEAAQDLDRAVDLSREANREQRLAFGYQTRVISEKALPAGQLQFAERAALQSITICRQLVQEDPRNANFRQHLGYSLGQLGLVLTAAGNHDRALQIETEYVEVMERALRDFPNDPATLYCLGASHFMLGDALFQLGKVEAIEQHFRRAVEAGVTTVAQSPDNSNYRQHESNSRFLLGRILERSGRLEEAIAEYRRAYQIENIPVPRVAVLARLKLASLLVHLGRADEAESLKSRPIAWDDAGSQNELAWYFATWANPAERDGPRALKHAEQAVSLTNRRDASMLDTLAAAHARCGNFPDAIRVQQEATNLVMNEQERKLKQFHLSLYQQKEACGDRAFVLEKACGLRAAGKFAPAEEMARECVKLLEKELPGSWQLFEAQSTLGGALLGQQKYKEAEPFLLACYEGLRSQTNSLAETRQRILEDVLRCTVQLYDATGQSRELAQWKQKLAELDAGRRGDDP